MNEWFASVFLPAIFERCKPGEHKWLTQKQTAVCCRYMQRQQMRYTADRFGAEHTHERFFCTWQGRKVTLEYSRKNGCGCIQFGLNGAEVAARQAEHEAEKRRIQANRVERIKRNPERLAQTIAALNRDIQGWLEKYALDVQDGEAEGATFCRERITALEAELALYMA